MSGGASQTRRNGASLRLPNGSLSIGAITNSTLTIFLSDRGGRDNQLTTSRDCYRDYPAKEAAIAEIGRNRTSGSSFEGKKPRRCQNCAASASTALTISARPPTSAAAWTQRCSACFSSPVPIPRPVQAVSVANCPRRRQGTGSGGWPVRTERGSTEGTTAVGARP